MALIFEQIRTGGDRNFGYLIGCGEKKIACVIDPSYDPQVIFERAEAQQLRIAFILNTHGHQDHINGNEEMRRLTGADIYGHAASPVAGDRLLKDGEEIKLGNYSLRIIFTPGHSRDHIVIYIPECQVLFTGDHLFVGKIGGTYTEDDAHEQYASLEKLYNDFPSETTIWPGHDYGARPSSTLALERISNPFIMAPDFERFLSLKSSWASFKAERGLL